MRGGTRSVVILPVIAFFIVGIAGVITFNLLNMVLLVFALLAIDALVVYVAVRTFQRERILVGWK